MHAFSLILDAFGSVATIAFGVWRALIALNPGANLPLIRVDWTILRLRLGLTALAAMVVLATILFAGGVRGLLKL